MLIEISHLATEAEHRRVTLLADADNFRLARLSRRAARRRRRDTPRTDPPRNDPPQGDPPRSDPSGPGGARGNDDAERRYAVSR